MIVWKCQIMMGICSRARSDTMELINNLFFTLFSCLSDSIYLASTAACHAQCVHTDPGASASQENKKRTWRFK